MSAKPTDVATWDSTLTGIVVPTAGHRASGFMYGEIPGAYEMNGWRNIVGQWTQYLSDGVLSLNDITVGGVVWTPTTKALPNAATNDFDACSGTIQGKRVIILTGGGASASITGILSTSAEEGRELWLVNETGAPFTIVIESSGSAAANRIDYANTPSGGVVTVPAKGAVLLVFTDPPTGRWAIRTTNFVPDVTEMIGPGVGREVGGTDHILNLAFWATGSSTDHLVWPLPFRFNRTISAWTIYIDKTSSVSLVGQLWKANMVTGVTTLLGTATNGASAPGHITLGGTGLSDVAAAGFQYYVDFSCGGGTFAPDDLIYGVAFTHHA